MIAATRPAQRPPNAKLLVADPYGHVGHRARSELIDLLHAGDLVIANDAATIPASLSGFHIATGKEIEVRLAGRPSLAPDKVNFFLAIAFGAGDFRTRTEDRPAPPPLRPGDYLTLGSLTAIVIRLMNHSRFIALEIENSPIEIWQTLARHGRPIQYAHLKERLAIWDSWTPIAGPPVAFEPPSAGFVLDWATLASMKSKGVRFATITHAAGISSTGDSQLDAFLPLDEPYRVPLSTAKAIAVAKARGNRIIAIGTSVVRALEHAARDDGTVWPGDAIATRKIGSGSRLRVIDAIVSGTHEPGTSHHELLRAFTTAATLSEIDTALDKLGYLTHEFGDSVFLEKSRTNAFDDRIACTRLCEQPFHWR